MRVAFVTTTAHQVVVAPVLIIAYTIILYMHISWISFIGLGIISGVIILSVGVGSLIGKISKKKFEQSDKRNKYVNDMVVGIK